MGLIILLIIGCLSLALFPTLNTAITGMPETDMSNIQKLLHQATPFLFLFAVFIAAWAISRRNQS
jgi:hypothetical protein